MLLKLVISTVNTDQGSSDGTTELTRDDADSKVEQHAGNVTPQTCIGMDNPVKINWLTNLVEMYDIKSCEMM